MRSKTAGFRGPVVPREVPASYREVNRAVTALVAAFEREGHAELPSLLDSCVLLIFRYANFRIAPARGHFLPVVCLLLTTVDRKTSMPPVAREHLLEDLTDGLESAGTVEELEVAFRSAVERLSTVRKRPEGRNVLRLEAALMHVRQNFASVMRLKTVARKAGFSVPVFTKLLKERTGSSLLPYVRAIRVEQATKLLVQPTMTLEEIAVGCGFRSTANMNRCFRLVTGLLPSELRAMRLRPDQRTR